MKTENIWIGQIFLQKFLKLEKICQSNCGFYLFIYLTNIYDCKDFDHRCYSDVHCLFNSNIYRTPIFIILVKIITTNTKNDLQSVEGISYFTKNIIFLETSQFKNSLLIFARNIIQLTCIFSNLIYGV